MSVGLLMLLLAGQAAPPPQDVPWAGEARARVLVRVDAAAAAGKEQAPETATNSPRIDERPADVRIEFVRLLVEQGIKNQVPDPASIQVIRHDAKTGRRSTGHRLPFGRGEFDIPLRWYDAAIPYEFPECNVNLADQRQQAAAHERRPDGLFLRMCRRLATTAIWHLCIAMTDKPAMYAVYFDLLPPASCPTGQPPRGFVGDGLNRCEPVGHSTTGLIHSRVDVVDFNGDRVARSSGWAAAGVRSSGIPTSDAPTIGNLRRATAAGDARRQADRRGLRRRAACDRFRR